MSTKTITVDEFVNRLQNAEINDEYDACEIVDDYDAFGEYQVKKVSGWVEKSVSFDGFLARYCAPYSHPVGKPSEAVIEENPAGGGYGFHLEEITFAVVDEDGDEIDRASLETLVCEHTDVTNLSDAYVGTDEQEEIDMETDDMNQITVRRDNDKDIRFRGEKIASESSQPDRSCGDYSGSVGRWSELTLYKTAAGRYVCSEVGRTQWQGEHDRHAAAVCETVAEVGDFFGYGWLAKKLYASAGLKMAEVVE